MATWKWFIPAAIAASFAAPRAEAVVGGRPNVLVILSDDQGYGDVSAHGNPVLKTPNLDKLRSESFRLTDFHVAPMCTPTRGQLLTGLDCLRSGASSVCAGRSFIRRGTPMMPELFKARGYRTGHFGKWHLGDSYPNLPHQRGFEETVYHLGWGITSMADLWRNDCFDGRFAHNGKLKEYPGYCTDVFFDEAMNYMRKRNEENRPFFVYLPTNAPHGPHWVDPKYSAPYREHKGVAEFFGMIANLDENLGRLDKFLEETKLAENTIVVYFNDNGGTGGVNLFNAGMRGRKTQYYDGGHRAMCFIKFPDESWAGPTRDIDQLTHVQDLFPTLVDLCGIDGPGNAKFDGVSLMPLFGKESKKLPERTLVVQYGQNPVKWESCVLRDKWRLVHGEELYHVGRDPGQEKNIAAELPEVVKQLREHYEKWWAEIEPRLQDFSPISIGAPQENPVTLTAADWTNVYCDNMNNLRAGKNENSAWVVQVEQAGDYEIELRRWPREADAPIAGGVPPFQPKVGKPLAAGVALPITSARLQIGASFDESQPVKADDKSITFRTKLAAGKTTMQSWFYDAEGKQLSGAYFTYVTRK
ncbi:MAG: arylsulfatase [Planctomycetales bacterium]|nr:arylsulfatase [Planctomycetales bacterium]